MESASELLMVSEIEQAELLELESRLCAPVCAAKLCVSLAGIRRSGKSSTD